MSHAPETSICNCNPYAEIGPTERALNCPIHGVKAAMSSRKLVEALARLSPVNPGLKWLDDAKALIEAWVLVRETEARREEAEWWFNRDLEPRSSRAYEQRLSSIESALATARKQLEEQP